MALGQCAHFMVVLWHVVDMVLFKNSSKACAVGSGLMQNLISTLVSPLELDDFQVTPTRVISPLHLFLANGKRLHRHSGVVFLQTGPQVSMIEHAAANCFWEMKLVHLKTFCEEIDLHPTTFDLLGHLEIMITTALPGLPSAQLTPILELMCRRGLTLFWKWPVGSYMKCSQLRM